MIFAIDPGKHTGIAVLSSNGVVLFAAELPPDFHQPEQREAMQAVWESAPEELYELTYIVCEQMQVYRHSKSKGDPNDLIKVAFLGGWIAAHAQAYAPTAKIVTVTPGEWKGQTPKDIHHDRIYKDLSDTEREHVADLLANIPKSRRHNVWDAIGLAKWYYKKTQRR